MYCEGPSAMGSQPSSENLTGGRALFPQARRVTDVPNKNPGPQYKVTDAVGKQFESTRNNPPVASFKNNSDRFPKEYPDVPGGLGPDPGNFKHRPASPHYSLAGRLRDQYEADDCSPGPIYQNDASYNQIGSLVRVGTRISPSARWHKSHFMNMDEICSYDPSSIGWQSDGRSCTKPSVGFSRAKRFR